MPIVGQAFDGIGQAFHLPHGAQGTQQGTRDQGLTAGAVRRAEVQVIVLHGQGGLAEQPAAEVLPIGDDAAAQVDEVAAQGKVEVHVDVGAVHGQRDPVLGSPLAAGGCPAGPRDRCGRRCRASGPPRRCGRRPRRRVCRERGRRLRPGGGRGYVRWTPRRPGWTAAGEWSVPGPAP